MKVRELPLFRRRVGAAIREQRSALALTQAALANRLACTIDYVGKVERGEQNITLDTLDRIFNALIEASSEMQGDPSLSPSSRFSRIGLLQVFSSDFGIHHQQNAHPDITHFASKAGFGRAHEKAHDWVREPLNRSERRIMVACRTAPRSTPELLKALGYTARTGNFKRGLSRLIKMQLLELSMPGRPRSKHQKYIITPRGRTWLAATRN